MTFSLTVLLLCIYSRKILALVVPKGISKLLFVIETNCRQPQCPQEGTSSIATQQVKRCAMSVLADMENVPTILNEKKVAKA